MTSTSSVTSSQRAVLRIGGRGGLPANQLQELLADLDLAYNGILLFEGIFIEANSGGAKTSHRSVERWLALGDLPSHLGFKRFVPSPDRLIVASVQLASPGTWEFLGKLNPLEVLRLYLEDRHRRRQDREYRESSERTRLEFENGALELAIVRDKLALAASMGVPPETLAHAAEVLLEDPLLRVARHVDDRVLDASDVQLRQLPT